MSTAAERFREEQQIASFHLRLKTCSEEMAKGSIQGLYDLKALLYPTEADEILDTEVTVDSLAGKIPSGTFLTLNVARDIVSKLWDNLGPGNLGFSPDSTPKIIELSKSLGFAIQEGAFKFDTENKAKAFTELGISYKLYLELMRETSQKVTTSDRSNWVTL